MPRIIWRPKEFSLKRKGGYPDDCCELFPRCKILRRPEITITVAYIWSVHGESITFLRRFVFWARNLHLVAELSSRERTGNFERVRIKYGRQTIFRICALVSVLFAVSAVRA